MAKKIKDKYEHIKNLFERSDMTDEEILDKIKQKEEDIKNKYPEWSEERILDQVFNSIYSDRKRIITDLGGEEFILEFFWSTLPFDWVEGWRKTAMDMFKKNPEKAIKDGYVRKRYLEGSGKEVIEPLYFKDKNRLGEESKMKGQPLPESSYMRFAGGVGKRISEKGDIFKPFEMDMSGLYSDPNSDDFRKIVFNQMLDINCGFNGENEGKFSLAMRSKTFFNKFNDFYELNPSIIESIYEDKIIPLTQIEEWFYKKVEKGDIWTSKTGTSRGTHDMVISRCLVISIEPAIQNRNDSVYVDDRSRGLWDEDGKPIESFRCWWRKDIPLDFGVESIVYLFYEVSQSQKKEGNEFTGDWQQITFNILGCVVLHRTKKEFVEVSSDEKVSEEEFIPELEILSKEVDEEISDDEMKDMEEGIEETIKSEEKDGELEF